MVTQTILFYALSAIIIFAASCVLILPNPIYAALSLAGTMIGLGFLYFQLDAYFIAGVQLIVYAGAVMVLFVMVLMLFDLKKETEGVRTKFLSTFIKMLLGVIVANILFWVIKTSIFSNPISDKVMTAEQQVSGVKELAASLFTKYLLAFEILGILLLVIAIGVVAVSRSKGGTHARD